MWPILLDMTKVDCKRMLRRLELEAYGNLVSALRAQGGLTSDKHKLLQDLSTALNIPQERHRAEVRRAVNDEKLATIAYCLTGDDTTDEWAIEGRRLVPLMPRMAPQTAYSTIADEEANKASLENEKMPLPAATERKRPLQPAPEPNKNIQYATSEFPSKHPNQFPVEDTAVKKRKTSMSMEGSTLAQHLIMGPPKISRVQQLYRQKTKAILKQQMKQRAAVPQQQQQPQPQPQHITTNVQQQKQHRKIEEEMKNISQLPTTPVPKVQENKSPVSAAASNNSPPINNENVATTSKITNVQVLKPVTTSSNNTTKVQAGSVVVNTPDMTSKSIKICPARKVITTTPRAQTPSQKLIIVSNSQGNTTSSILQRTLTIPFKTISMKNLDKLKVINTTTAQSVNSTTATVVNQKPKLLTVHTKVKSNTAGKQINIPFIQGVQLQALQNKGAIKMVPLSTTTKITSKSGIVNTSGSVYIMNSNAISAVTPSNSSPIMTAKPQSSTEEGQRNVFIIKNEEIKSGVPVINNETTQNLVLLNVHPQKDQKSSVLSDILKASGVIPDEQETETVGNDSPQEPCDIESQISQLTEIPSSENQKNLKPQIEQVLPAGSNIKSECVEIELGNNVAVENLELEEVDESNVEEVEKVEMPIDEIGVSDGASIESTNVEDMSTEQEIVQFENEDEITAVPETNIEESDYVVLDESATESEMLVCELENVQTTKENTEMLEVMGNLNPETGMYSIQESTDGESMIQETVQESTSSYVIEMDSIAANELDMPGLGLN